MRKSEEKRINYKSLFSLYLSFLLNKKTIIAIIISISFLAFSLSFISNVEDITLYLASPLSYHQAYFSVALLLIGILNGVLISFFVINLSINSLSFDVLFISYIRRERLSLIKLLTMLIILFIILTAEFALTMIIALIKFNNFRITNELILSFYYNYVSMAFEALVSIGLTEVFNIIITPLFVLFSFLIIRILMNNYQNFRDLFYNFIPYLSYNSKKNIFEYGNSLVAVVLIISLIFLYIQIYSIKDIK